MPSAMRRFSRTIVFTLLLTVACGGRLAAAEAPAAAAQKLAAAGIFGPRMVLQRDLPIPVWGRATPGATVTVEVGPAKSTAVATADGNWQVSLAPQPAGGPFTMSISSTADTAKLSFPGVLFGEVWLASGQSNMEWYLKSTADGAAAVEAANHPELRLCKIPRRAEAQPTGELKTKWSNCTPGAAKEFSAVAYYFARELQRELKVPVGIIAAAVSGSHIEPWTPAPERKGPVGAQAKTRPGGFYNGMIHPLVPFALRGVIWYQGESNRRDGGEYFDKQRQLIADWRQAWERPDLPFFLAQVAPFPYNPKQPMLFPALREAQARAAAEIPGAGMIVTNDIGDLSQIHPPNKLDVGRRFALLALAKVYGRKDLVYSGPIYKSCAVEGDAIRISFDHVGSGLATRDGAAPSWFTIAGEDRKFQPAEAVIEGNTVVVRQPKVPKPVAVRFAWDEIAQPNLMNREGLPAPQFRTDSWKLDLRAAAAPAAKAEAAPAAKQAGEAAPEVDAVDAAGDAADHATK